MIRKKCYIFPVDRSINRYAHWCIFPSFFGRSTEKSVSFPKSRIVATLIAFFIERSCASQDAEWKYEISTPSVELVNRLSAGKWKWKEKNKVPGRNTLQTYHFVFVSKLNKKHIDASVKERPQTLLVLSEEICKRVLCNEHI